MKSSLNDFTETQTLNGGLFTERSTTGLFGASVMKYGMFLGVLGVICLVAALGLNSGSKSLNNYNPTRRVLQYIQGESLPELDYHNSTATRSTATTPATSTSTTSKETPNLPLFIDKKFKELSNLKEIDILGQVTKKQKSIALVDPKEEYRGILNKKRRHFINRIVSSLKDKSEGCMKDTSNGVIANSTIMPLLYRESAIREEIGGKVGSLVLTDGITEGNGLREILGNTGSGECMYLHMIIPADVFKSNNYYFGDNPKSLWEVGCKIFRLNKIDSD